MPEERLAVGDSVRFNVATLSARFPRADSTVNVNSPMLIAAIDKVTNQVTVTRQGVAYGVFGEGELEKVDPDTGLPPEPPPPDTLAGGQARGGPIGGGQSKPNPNVPTPKPTPR